MNTAPIGVFDSGLGGLTAVKELRALLPGEDIVYFGDTGRVPYGSRGRDILIEYAKQDVAFLLAQGVKTIVAACGTVSSTLPEGVAQSLPVPYTGVVAPAARAAAIATQNKIVGVIGTEATVFSGSYEKALKALLPDVECVAMACPLFVPLVENGRFAPNDPLARMVAEEYLAPVRDSGADTVILGCTHYPLLTATIAEILGDGVALIDPGRETALWLRDELARTDALHGRKEGGSVRYFVTDDPDHFDKLAGSFLGYGTGGRVQRVNIEQYRL